MIRIFFSIVCYNSFKYSNMIKCISNVFIQPFHQLSIQIIDTKRVPPCFLWENTPHVPKVTFTKLPLESILSSRKTNSCKARTWPLGDTATVSIQTKYDCAQLKRNCFNILAHIKDPSQNPLPFLFQS